MFVRYQTVRNVVIVLAIAGGVWWFTQRPDKPSDTSETVPADHPLAPTPSAQRDIDWKRTDQLATVTIGGEPIPATDIILGIFERPARSKKAKDALGSGPKVNLYDDDQDGTWDRAKVDIDRDETWDERWTRKDGLVERRIVATGAIHAHRNGEWVVKRAATSPQPTSPAPTLDPQPVAAPEPKPEPALAPSTSPTPPVEAPTECPLNVLADHKALATRLLSARATSKKIKDVNRGAGIKINLYDDQGDGVWDRAKLDLDRDDSWDESWTHKSGRVERKCTATSARAVWTGSGWTAK